MSTIKFFNRILPEQGHYVLAVFKGGMNRPPVHYVTDSLTKLSRAVQKAELKQIPVYHACSSYADPKGIWDERKQKHRVRVVDNTAFVRSQWVDVDVGPGKDYATRKEAVQAVVAMCKQLRIPPPMFVASGALGLHLYWTFTRDVPVADAKLGAEAFSAALKSVGFKHDTTRTRDMASILRPVGSHNRKSEPVEVRVLRDSENIDPDQFYGAFDKFRAPKIIAIEGSDSEWESGTNEYPPSSAKLIVKKCHALYDVAKARGDVSEPYWRAMIGLVKHTTEGEKLCHTWSKGDPRYNAAHTQEKIDGWEKGPTTCEQFSRYSDRCEKCPMKGKQTSPIQLGYSIDAPPPDKTPPPRPKTTHLINHAVDHYAKKLPKKGSKAIPFWPENYYWDGMFMQRWVKDDDGGGEWKPFSKVLYYPFLRYETEDGTRALKVCALVDPVTNRWRIFDMDMSRLYEAKALASSLHAHEVVYMPKSNEANLQFVHDILHGIRDHGLETTTYSSFGWHDDGFVLGDMKITPKGATPVFLSSTVPSALQGDFGTAGSASEWARIVDQIYNRPGAEAYQFLVTNAFAAPLVKLSESDLWHGIPTGVTGPSGEGKSTASLVACSAFGNPHKMMLSANEEGTTMNALVQRVAAMRNLPLVLDEITGRETNELQAMLFALSNGKPKLRLRPDGTEIGSNHTWDTCAFITGNLSITNMLADSDRAKADATQVRCFEIPVHQGDTKKLFHDIDSKDLIENQLLANNYGHAGREFLRYVMRNRAAVTKALQKQRSLLTAGMGVDSRERFYYDLIATNLVAANICNKIGLLNFDLGRLKAWALKHVRVMRAQRRGSLDTPEDLLQAFLSYLTQHTVTTKYFRDGREKLPGTENVIPPYKEPHARHAREDKRFLVTQKAYHSWCASVKMNHTWLMSEWEKAGYIEADRRRMRIFTGTHMAGNVQARCIEFDYEALSTGKLTMPEYIQPVDNAEED